MSTTTDPTFELIRSGHEAALNALLLIEQARQAMLKLQVQALEDDIKGGQRILAAMSAAPDWNTFHGIPARMLAEQLERNAEFARAAGKLSVETGAGFLEHLRAGTEHWAEYQRNALGAGGGFVPPLSDFKSMFDNVSQVMMWPETRAANQPVAASARS